MPVYIARQHHEMAAAWMPMILATAGVLAGTFVGVKLLRLIPENVFRRAVGVLILALGAYMFVRAIGGSS
jgi:uncharacterized membrane protein YfcA